MIILQIRLFARPIAAYYPLPAAHCPLSTISLLVSVSRLLRTVVRLALASELREYLALPKHKRSSAILIRSTEV
jgi:hypothetical protein